MQLFLVLSCMLTLSNSFITNFPRIIYPRQLLTKTNAVYTSYNPMNDDFNKNITKRVMIIIPDNNGTSPHLRPGYPREAFKNITYPPMNDDNLGEEIGDITQNNKNDDHPFNEFKKYFPNAMQNSFQNKHGEPVKLNINETDEEVDEAIRRELQDALGVRFFVRRPPHMEQQQSESSENFEIIKNPPYSFADVGGYENVKDEMMQSVDMLQNFEKYQKFNVRTPKGIILEGPPGNGKTLLARAFSGEVNSSFIPVSGSQFQEKYVGVGASRIRELFDLAESNLPCVIFIDEIDAVGRSRSSDDGSSSGERDQTLNQLLVALDGYKNTSGVFIVGATNRMDLLDDALVRPGRIDKKIYIGNPDSKTREAILDIHIKGKPHSRNVTVNDLVDITNGLSGAQIENLLNEAMLFALRDNREIMNKADIETILGRIYVGYQPTENAFSDDMIKRIAIHEMGHAIVGLLSAHHSKLVKVCLNLWSPSSPGYTIFETEETDSSIYTKEKLIARLMVLLSGRIAEEVFYGTSITSGASKDIEQAYKLAENMIVRFGMGRKTVYAHGSESSKDFIDRDIERLLESAYQTAHTTVLESQKIIEECADNLIENKLLLPDDILKVIHFHHINNKRIN